MEKKYTIDDLLEILKVLRGGNGCPWDKVQTHESIKKNMIEESYEAIDALDSKDDAAFANERGDVLMQVAFHATLAKERGAFCFDDILREVCTKLISRHTHVFGSDKATTAEEALSSWEKNKMKEKNIKSDSQLLRDVPHSLPSLMRAQKVQKKAESCGFEFESADELAKKLSCDAAALSEECEKDELLKKIESFLFETANLARLLGIDAETALGHATNEFIRKF